MSMALGISPLCPTKVQSWRWAAARREGGIAQLGALDGHSHSAGPSRDPMQRCWWHHVGGDPCTASTHHLWQGRGEVIVIDPPYCIGGWQARDLLGVFPPNISFLELTILLQFSGNVDPPQWGNLGLLTHGFPLCPAIWKSKTGCLRYVKKRIRGFPTVSTAFETLICQMYIYICMCVYIYIRIYIYVCVYVYTHTYIHTYITLHYITLHYIIYIILHYITLHYIHTYIYIYMYTYYVHVHVHVYLYICIYIHIYLYICIYMYIHTHMYVCMYM